MTYLTEQNIHRNKNLWNLQLPKSQKLTTIERKIRDVLLNWKQFKTCILMYLVMPHCNLIHCKFTLWLSFRASCSHKKKVLRCFAKILSHKYREKTTPSRIFLLCSLSYCRVESGIQTSKPISLRLWHINLIQIYLSNLWKK